MKNRAVFAAKTLPLHSQVVSTDRLTGSGGCRPGSFARRRSCHLHLTISTSTFTVHPLQVPYHVDFTLTSISFLAVLLPTRLKYRPQDFTVDGSPEPASPGCQKSASFSLLSPVTALFGLRQGDYDQDLTINLVEWPLDRLISPVCFVLPLCGLASPAEARPELPGSRALSCPPRPHLRKNCPSSSAELIKFESIRRGF